MRNALMDNLDNPYIWRLSYGAIKLAKVLFKVAPKNMPLGKQRPSIGTVFVSTLMQDL